MSEKVCSIILVVCAAISALAYLCLLISWWMHRPTLKHSAVWAAHKKYMASIAPKRPREDLKK